MNMTSLQILENRILLLENALNQLEKTIMNGVDSFVEKESSESWNVAFDLNGEDNALQMKLRCIVKQLGWKSAFFKRTPIDYYDWLLEKRKEFLGAPSEEYLCKCIVMVNANCNHEHFSDAKDSKYYMVIVQYTTKLNTESLNKFLAKFSGVSNSRVNMRLCSAEKSVFLTGYSHNSVTPIGCKSNLPIIVAEPITLLGAGYFWLGGGEIDVKIRVSWKDFLKLNPIVAKITDHR